MPTGQYTRKRKPLLERFWKYVRILPSGCWEWTGYIGRSGYGRFAINSRSKDAHVEAYKFFVGDIPSGMQIDHTCHDPKTCDGGVTCSHRRCVNPAHLKLATHKENCSVERTRIDRRVAASVAAHRAIDTCPYGHRYTPENTRYTKKGGRYCVECFRRRSREYAATRRADKRAAQSTH